MAVRTFFAFVLSLALVPSVSGEATKQTEEIKEAATVDELAEAARKDIDRLLNLGDLKELAKKNNSLEIYRLTVGRTFNALLVFELSVSDGPDFWGHLYVKKIRPTTSNDNPAALGTFRLVRDSHLKLEAQEGRSLGSLLEGASFWTLPEEDWRPPGLDGSGWTLEGIRGGVYHKVERSNPFVPMEKMFAPGDKVPLPPERAFAEGALNGAFIYLWTLAGEAGEDLY